jgi:transcriptional regulator with XRE-family HTH domain
MPLTLEQCKAARSLLGWSQADLAKSSGISTTPIADFERGKSQPQRRTLEALQTALEKAGIQFFDEDDIGGIGVRLRKGVKPIQSSEQKSSRVGLPNDPDMCALYDYWRNRPDEWQELSYPSRRAVLREIFGDVPDADPIIECPEIGENNITAPQW